MTATYSVGASLHKLPPDPIKPGTQAAATDLCTHLTPSTTHLTPSTKPLLSPSPAPSMPDTILSQALAYIELFESYHQQHRGDISQLQQLVQELQEDRASQDEVIARLAADKGAQEQAASELAVEMARQQRHVQALHNDWAELHQMVSDLLDGRAGVGGQPGDAAGASKQLAALQREKSALCKAQEGLQEERDSLASRWAAGMAVLHDGAAWLLWGLHAAVGAACCIMGLLGCCGGCMLLWGLHAA
jgi:hypothetical protein